MTAEDIRIARGCETIVRLVTFGAGEEKVIAVANAARISISFGGNIAFLTGATAGLNIGPYSEGTWLVVAPLSSSQQFCTLTMRDHGMLPTYEFRAQNTTGGAQYVSVTEVIDTQGVTVK